VEASEENSPKEEK